MNYNGTFNPKFLSGTQLYFAKNTATPSLWNDQSPNVYDLTQGTAIQQPTIGIDSVDFDGSNDFMSRSVTNPFISHTQGIVFFSINAVSGSTQRFLVVNLTSAGAGRNQFSISYIGDRIRAIVRNADATINNVFETVNTFGTGFLYGYIQSNGSTYTISVNGVVQTLSFVIGSNTGAWMNVISSNVISIARLQSGAFIEFTPVKLNKLYYNNTILSASDLWKTEQFFANPLNYD
jgi:hypothetical protein